MSAASVTTPSSGITVAVLGVTGQVGTELMAMSWPDEVTVVGLDRTALDLSEPGTIADVLDAAAPAVVINAAAYTAVDAAERDPATAYAINAVAVEALAAACAEQSRRLVHLSTDYVYDGTKGEPYTADDRPRPLGVYGRSKLAGEQAVLAGPGNAVVRTAWVYSATGNNFVKTMRRLAAERDRLGVVADQYGNPTSAVDIARATQAVALAAEAANGIVHAVAPDSATWWEFAAAIVAATDRADAVTVDAITTADYPTPAARPADTRLDDVSLFDAVGFRLRPWRTALAEVTAALDVVDHT